jgi:hypothetical protein
MSLLSWFFRTPPDPIDSLIKPPRKVYSGHDESRHVEAQKRMASADALRAHARRVELQERRRYQIVRRG